MQDVPIQSCEVIHGELLEDIESVLTDMPGIWILYLVRGPRGVISCRTKIEQIRRKVQDVEEYLLKRKKSLVVQARRKCDIYVKNIQYLKSEYNHSTKCSTYRDYFRIVR